MGADCRRYLFGCSGKKDSNSLVSNVDVDQIGTVLYFIVAIYGTSSPRTGIKVL